MPWARPWESCFLHGEGRDVAKASNRRILLMEEILHQLRER